MIDHLNLIHSTRFQLYIATLIIVPMGANLLWVMYRKMCFICAEQIYKLVEGKVQLYCMPLLLIVTLTNC